MAITSGYNNYPPPAVSLQAGAPNYQTGVYPQAGAYPQTSGYGGYPTPPPSPGPYSQPSTLPMPPTSIPQAGVPPTPGTNASEMLSRQTQINQLRTIRGQMMVSAMTERATLQQMEEGLTETRDNMAMAYSTAVMGDGITQAAKDLKNAEKAL
jgi:hypothetical protein